MEQNPPGPPQQHSNPSSLLQLPQHPKIKPLLQPNPRATTIKEDHILSKSQKSHSRISKAINSVPTNPLSQLYIQRFLSILQSQSQLSHLCYSPYNEAFNNSYFSSKLKNLQTLSSFKISVDCGSGLYQELKSTTKNLPSLKRLKDFQIQLFFYNLTCSTELHKLFKRLLPLKNLTSFSFEMITCARFDAKDSKTFFSYVSKFTQLQSLKLKFHRSIKDNDECFIALTTALSSLTLLKQTDIHFGGMESLQAENLLNLFKVLGNMKNLTDITFGLEDCEIINKDSTIEPLSKSLQYLNPSSIQKISLCPYIENQNLVQISRVLKTSFTSLKILTLHLEHSQQVTNADMAELSSALSELVLLNSLTIVVSSYAKTRNTVLSIASALKYLQNLIHLKLDCHGLHTSDHDQIREFASSLKTLKSSLKILELNFSEQLKISDLTVQSLAEAIKELRLLQHLSLGLSMLSKNTITSKGFEEICFGIQDLRNLSHLALSFSNNNQLNDLSPLAHVLRCLPDLYSADFDFCMCQNLKYEQNGLKSLLVALREVAKIREITLKISSYHRSSEEFKHIVSFIRKTKILNLLYSWA